MPFNLPKRLWDTFQAINIIITIFIFSLIIFFKMEEENYLFYVNFAFISFIIDICFNFNTGFLKKGNVIIQRNKIALNYFKKLFILDTLAIVPLLKYYFNFKINN